MNKKIFETENFVVGSPSDPHVSRTDGGHIVISPKVKVVDRTELSPLLAIELMRLTMLTGKAMSTVLNKNGVDIGRINYQDNGNWSVFRPTGPYLHIHLYGRAKSAKIHKYGDACTFPHRETGFYDNFEPLNDDDIKQIGDEIENLSKEEKYQIRNWHL
jgi:diadenosine tetraphosphate (Ap4A) HIT family hydrolase